MRKNSGDSGWLCYFIAVILILAGVFVEPLAAVLGILVVVASLISKLVESNAHRKLVKKAEEEIAKAEQAAKQKTT